MPLALKGATSGQVTIQAPAVAGTNTLTAPAVTGNLLTDVTPGTILQIVNYQTGALATGTTLIPFDNTIPQNTEGDQYMSLTITPKSATSKLLINVVFMGGHSVSSASIAVGLFQDSIANALAVGWNVISGIGFTNINYSYYMTSGTTSSTTFKVRAGSNSAGTTSFNGYAGAAEYGGTLASSITITEIAA